MHKKRRSHAGMASIGFRNRKNEVVCQLLVVASCFTAAAVAADGPEVGQFRPRARSRHFALRLSDAVNGTMGKALTEAMMVPCIVDVVVR